MTTKVFTQNPAGQQVLKLSFNSFGVMEHFAMPFEVTMFLIILYFLYVKMKFRLKFPLS